MANDIPYAYLVKFSSGIENMTDQAKRKLRLALSQVDMSDPAAARDEMAAIMERIVGASDVLASTMAASFYDGIREYQTGEKLGASTDSGRDPDSTKNATYSITHRLLEADEPGISLVEGLLAQRVGYEIQRAVGRTMYRNGERDPLKPKFARIPLGGDSCEFCRMLASRGFAYNSERSAGKHDPDHYHDGCRCRVVCSWDDDPRIAGMTEEEHGDAARSYAERDHSKHHESQEKKRRNRYTADGKLRAGYSGLRIDKQADYTEADRKKEAVRAAAQRGNTQRGRKAVSIEIDELTPCLRRLSDGEIVKTSFERVSPKRADFKQWEFDWSKPEKAGYEVYALRADGDDRVQGLVSIKAKPENLSVEVGLAESAPFNSSHNQAISGKEYSGVGAHLFAEAVRVSRESGYNGFVEFTAKTGLIDYYQKELGATQIGSTQGMFIDERAAKALYERYYGKNAR